MFFHEDLNLYKNKKFRSLTYIDYLWTKIEFELIYILGLIDTGNITLDIEPDTCQIMVTSNFKSIYNKEISLNVIHCLNNCLDFTIDITINLSKASKDFYLDVENCKLYFCKKNKDEGFIEMSITTNFSISTIDKFKEFFYINLSREIQYAINKNIFNYDIEKENSIISEIDSDFELIRAFSYVKNKNLSECLTDLTIKKYILEENLSLIKSLLNLLNIKV